MVDRTFRELLDGKIEYLVLAVCPSATRAQREDPNVGLWKLSGEQFRAIAASIREQDVVLAQTDAKRRPRSLQQIADDCDETGIENRFFRLNAAVAAWIDGNEPEPTVIDYMVL
jgi:hypothetical protein